MDRRFWVVVGIAVVAAVLCMAWQTPDAGPALVLTPMPQTTPPMRLAVQTPAPTPRDRVPAPPVELHSRDRLPRSPIDRNMTFTADLKGLATAAVSRLDDLRACMVDHQDQYGPAAYQGRFTIQVRVLPEVAPTGRPKVQTEVVNGPDDPVLADCAAQAMGDAKFDVPEHETSMIWPVPMPFDSALAPEGEGDEPLPEEPLPEDEWLE